MDTFCGFHIKDFDRSTFGRVTEVQYRPGTFDCIVRQHHGAGIVLGGEMLLTETWRLMAGIECTVDMED
jgi:hypothetical protein